MFTTRKRITLLASTAQRKLPSVPSEIPPRAWHTLGTDLFYWKNSDYLVIGNYFSKYLIVRKLPSSTGTAVCKKSPASLQSLVNHTSLEVITDHATQVQNSKN